jgi:hypothetical protein
MNSLQQTHEVRLRAAFADWPASAQAEGAVHVAGCCPGSRLGDRHRTASARRPLSRPPPKTLGRGEFDRAPAGASHLPPHVVCGGGPGRGAAHHPAWNGPKHHESQLSTTPPPQFGGGVRRPLRGTSIKAVGGEGPRVADAGVPSTFDEHRTASAGCPSPDPSPFVPHGEGRIRSRCRDFPPFSLPHAVLGGRAGEGGNPPSRASSAEAPRSQLSTTLPRSLGPAVRGRGTTAVARNEQKGRRGRGPPRRRRGMPIR